MTDPEDGGTDHTDGRSGEPARLRDEPRTAATPPREEPVVPGSWGRRPPGVDPNRRPVGTPPTPPPASPAPRPTGLPPTVPGAPRPVLPQRPPVPTGVPPRPTPLPPPRPGSPSPVGAARADAPTQAIPTAGAATTVVPSRATGQPAPPRQPLTSAVNRPGKGRKARLALRRLDPWSVFVTSLLLSLFLAVVTIVAAVVLYGVLSQLGVPDSINKSVTDVKGGAAVLTRGRFIGGAALLAAINVVLLTALATLGALLYNVCASFTGGLELTLAERD